MVISIGYDIDEAAGTVLILLGRWDAGILIVEKEETVSLELGKAIIDMYGVYAKYTRPIHNGLKGYHDVAEFYEE